MDFSTNYVTPKLIYIFRIELTLLGWNRMSIIQMIFTISVKLILGSLQAEMNHMNVGQKFCPSNQIHVQHFVKR